ncbi:2-hydroxyacid dehydrogenase [Sulfuracidifex tepidarius]|uniref:Glyoxylate reductase n=1 Tax=Sulfuracidifex tepidarius TaxID=1294262 RepID=A0A510DYX6_9CREN|nr:2-hydroxyacid dehydrogenase [Sulfuracidifex tepidarius]BBG25452.1 Glyoxylate reductase [Sulfuracidifex tepidarius]BBG28246.1 Glyoxylate reductase [Sulfuracidifex tepidarius]
MIISTQELPGKLKEIIPINDKPSEKDIEEAEIIVGWPKQINKLLDKCKNLKVIQTFSAGVDDLDFKRIKEARVFSNAGAYSIPVAEHAWGLILGAAKGVNSKERLIAYQVCNKTLLVLGAGGIGIETARIGKNAFHTFNIGLSRSFKDKSVFDTVDSVESLHNYVEKADIIVDALPLNNSTKNILNYNLLRNVKNNCIIVNVGRGETVDEEDMFKLLSQRSDIRFATDVFWRKEDGKEDFLSSPLWSLKNFFGTFHTAGAYGNEEVMLRAMEIAIRNVQSFLRDGRASNEVRVADYL